VGLDLNYAFGGIVGKPFWTPSSKNYGSESDGDSSGLECGVILGKKSPLEGVFDKIWIGYYFLDKVSYKNHVSGDDDAEDTWSGTALKAGLGIVLSSFMSVNIEYSKHRYTSKTEVRCCSTTTYNYPYLNGDDKTSEIEESSLGVSLSFPFKFKL